MFLYSTDEPWLTLQNTRSSLTRLETGVNDIHKQVSSLQALHQQDNTAQKQLSIQQQNDTHQSLKSILTAQDRLQLRMDLVEVATIARTAESAARYASESSGNDPSLINSMDPPQPTMLKAIIPGCLDCVIGCRCSCHVRRTISISSLQRFLGSLFVGYVGLPLITPKCDDFYCRQRAHPITLITYIFPPWLLARVFHLAFRLLPHAGPELTIRVFRVVPRTSAIFDFARCGDLEGIRKILTQGIGSPLDVEDVSGMSALGVC